MCGRYSFFSRDDILEDRFQAHFSLPIKRHYNAAPSQPLPIITTSDPHHIIAGKWGLLPRWTQKRNTSRGIINARADSLTTKKSFIKPIEQRRCLVLADSFFEWTRKSDKKFPYRILLADEQPFAFAGIYELYQPSPGITIPTFSIITVPANELINRLHDRMPAILQRDTEQPWLDPSTDMKDIFNSLKPYQPKKMKMYQVTPQMNSARYESKDIIKPL